MSEDARKDADARCRDRMGQKQAQQQMAQAEAYKQQGAQEAMAQQQATQAAAPSTEDVIAQIEKLSALHQSGALTDEEVRGREEETPGPIPSLLSNFTNPSNRRRAPKLFRLRSTRGRARACRRRTRPSGRNPLQRSIHGGRRRRFRRGESGYHVCAAG